MASVEAIDSLLPQTQCGECGHPGCLPYAQALAEGTDPINLCPPGGVVTLKALGHLLNIDPTPYLESTKQNTREPAQAVIRESECIGCTKCIQACPVDAIIGANKTMHTVLADECTGCMLCVEPCPVDCIDIIPQPEAHYDKALARNRFNARQLRTLKQNQAKERTYREKRLIAASSEDKQTEKKAKLSYIQQAIARIQAKKDHE